MRIAFLLLLLASATAMADTPAAKGFDPYKGARMLCKEHVSGKAMHVVWTSWATKDDVATVAAHYEKATGGKPQKGDQGELRFSDDKDLRLQVYPAEKNDSFPKCATKPAAGERTVVLISQAIR
ncbi:MAG: hypothetical protein KF773_17680 [Deltaproteobacteria bacterium]|nr:hypothetical protein [Deltaproteobacteria bacterium]